jgi:hypothetical protein
MKTLGRVWSLTIGLGVALVLVGHFNSGTTRAVDREHVKVVNSASDPVPVTGTVKATQSGPWKVGIDGTPTVNVASAPPVNVTFPSSVGINGTVPVQNAPGLFGFNPLIVQDFENPARTAFQSSCAAGGTGTASCNLPQVPSTKTLVIETVSVAMSSSGNAPPLFTSLTTTAGGVQAQRFFAPTLTGTAGVSLGFYSVNTLVRIYADPGSSIAAFVESTTQGSPQVTWTSRDILCARTTKQFAEKAMTPGRAAKSLLSRSISEGGRSWFNFPS